MLRWFAIIVTMLFVLPVMALAADPVVEETVPVRYLTAEAQRTIQNEFDIVEQNIKQYQDENFLALDGQMRTLMQNTVQKLVIGILGAILIGSSLMALLMYKLAKRYSLKDYEDRVRQLEGSQQQMQQEWVMPQQQTFSGEYGQATASNASVFNNWQVQPPRQGGWEWDGGRK